MAHIDTGSFFKLSCEISSEYYVFYLIIFKFIFDGMLSFSQKQGLS